MKDTKADKKARHVYPKLLVVLRVPILLLLLFLLAYFVLVPVILKVRSSYRGENVSVVAVDGSQDYISLGPDKQTFIVDVASQEVSRQRGLSDRSSLDQSHGMLFVFDQPNEACLWMKDMLFDIDMLWFDQDRKLVHIKSEATPASYPESFCTPTPAKYIIEVAAGTSERLHLKIGDTFSQP